MNEGAGDAWRYVASNRCAFPQSIDIKETVTIMMGGLAGNLYDAFNDLGRLFFTFLIGRSRAIRPSLQDSRVRVGGFLFFSLLSTVIMFIVFVTNPPERPRNEMGFFAILALSVTSGMSLGFFMGLIITGILISYARKIEREIRWERQQAELEERRKNYYQDLISKGVDPAEARIKAQSLGAGCTSTLVLIVILLILLVAISL